MTVIDKPRWKVVKSKADELTKTYTAPPIPVLDIAERNGVDVVFATFDPNVAGFCDFRSAKLYVNDIDPVNRKTFTMAHELGHWLLHREFYLKHPEKYPVLPRFQRNPSNDPLEKEANFFARNLLVPDRLLAPVAQAPLSWLADAFAVSQEMMTYRLRNVQGW